MRKAVTLLILFSLLLTTGGYTASALSDLSEDISQDVFNREKISAPSSSDFGYFDGIVAVEVEEEEDDRLQTIAKSLRCSWTYIHKNYLTHAYVEPILNGNTRATILGGDSSVEHPHYLILEVFRL